jgi:hypothetical protein
VCSSVCLARVYMWGCGCFFFQWLYSPCGPWPLFRFPDLFTGCRTPWTSDQLVARPLPKHTTTQTHTPLNIHASRRDSNPQSRPPSDRRLFMPQSARISRPALWMLILVCSNAGFVVLDIRCFGSVCFLICMNMGV